jgi:hypothetical protein
LASPWARSRFVLLAASLATAAAPAIAADVPDSGVMGRVTVYPTCPGPEPYPPAGDCGPKGIPATIRIKRLPERTLVKVIHSGEHGRFRTTLPPGHYRLRADPGEHAMSCDPRTITVEAHEFRHRGIGCDSGMR